MDVISKLQRNPKEIYREVSRLLIKIAENILQDPSNKKLRTLHKSNSTISNKILNVFGGIDCLLLMGFEEQSSCLTLPLEASLEKLKEVRDDIVKYEGLYYENNGAIPRTDVPSPYRIEEEVVEEEEEEGANELEEVVEEEEVEDEEQEVKESDEIIRKIELPPFKRKYPNDFLNNIAYRFHIAQLHDNKELHKRALDLIPVTQLNICALCNLRTIQLELKKGAKEHFDVTIQDMLLLELLDWFKNNFFTWVDSPACAKCDGPTTFSHMSKDPDMLLYADRVELHRCPSCNIFTPFPRYNDLNILLATRKGRCGEWANCFTLFCRALAWDARHVFDETDHVWTEVYSYGAKRWLHCDPCENVCDSPLMYEAGWNKNVTYVMAYSGEEVQDVTWRYTSKHKKVLLRRHNCTEEELVDAMMELRRERQTKLSVTRRKYLSKRLLEELCELMIEKQPTANDKKGRTSGSLSWIKARREHRLDHTFEPYVWKFSDEDLVENCVSIRYYTVSDFYQYDQGKLSRNLGLWRNGISAVEGIFRKVENDWRMVYLSRMENSMIGKIKWTFEIAAENKIFDIVDIYFDYTLYEDAKVEVSLLGDSGAVNFLPDQKAMTTQELTGSKKIELVAILSGGKGDLSWQHAQLFRQSMESKEHSFSIVFTFKNV